MAAPFAKPLALFALAALQTLTLTAAQSPCMQGDQVCWSQRARIFTNEIRATDGVPPLDDGVRAQLDNAAGYAQQLIGIGSLVHQTLSEATAAVGCGRFIGGENIALVGTASLDPARVCVDLWRDSPGHRANIAMERFTQVSIGIAFTPDGNSAYCVQTFSQAVGTAPEGDGTCAELEDSPDANNPAPTAASPSPGSTPVTSAPLIMPVTQVATTTTTTTTTTTATTVTTAAMAMTAQPTTSTETQTMATTTQISGPILPGADQAPVLEPATIAAPAAVPLQPAPAFLPPKPAPAFLPPKPAPRPPRRSPRVGRAACKCLRRGRRCSYGLAHWTRGACYERKPSRYQPQECVDACCEYVRYKSDGYGRIRSRFLRRLCHYGGHDDDDKYYYDGY